MMSTRFFPMSCTSPATVARRTLRPVSRSDPARKGWRVSTLRFMTSADLSTNGSSISPRPKRSPTCRIDGTRVLLITAPASAGVFRLSPPRVGARAEAAGRFYRGDVGGGEDFGGVDDGGGHPRLDRLV